MMWDRPLRHYFGLLLLTLFAVLVHGYHLGTDDAAIYIPAIKKAFDPQLYPFGSEFFMEHGRLSIFSPLVAISAHLFHLPIDVAIFLWYVFGIFLLLMAGWRIACLCFSSMHARWAAVLLLAALLTVPIAGTALVIADPYLTARSLSTPATIFAIDNFLRGKKTGTFLWIVLTALVHPQMAVFAIGFLLFLYWTQSAPPAANQAPSASIAAITTYPSRWPQGFNCHPPQGTYRDVLYSRTFFFAALWHWYEWLGVVFPVLILYLLTHVQPRATLPAFHRICRALVPFGIVSTLAFLVLSSTRYLANFVRLQPMRSFHLLYVLFYLLVGGLLGEYVLKHRAWLWFALFASLAVGMSAVNWSMFPHSRPIEWPIARSQNAWVSAFLWIRNNTGEDAVFALNPHYMTLDGEDQHGFRAIAERSMLADADKDSGAVSLFPQLTSDWENQQRAQSGWTHFRAADFIRLAHEYPVTWVVVQSPASNGLLCPYQNSAVAVCRIPVTLSAK
ncbi:MAG: hypothetical protein WCE63_09575 [Acidobacteriaceae bacterium]